MKCFEALGLAPTATPDEVKAAWRNAASRTHPDLGGDAIEFDRLRKAYQEALAAAEAPKPCIKCNGCGKIQRASGWSSINLPCARCGGSGYEQ